MPVATANCFITITTKGLPLPEVELRHQPDGLRRRTGRLCEQPRGGLRGRPCALMLSYRRSCHLFLRLFLYSPHPCFKISFQGESPICSLPFIISFIPTHVWGLEKAARPLVQIEIKRQKPPPFHLTGVLPPCRWVPRHMGHHDDDIIDSLSSFQPCPSFRSHLAGFQLITSL